MHDYDDENVNNTKLVVTIKHKVLFVVFFVAVVAVVSRYQDEMIYMFKVPPS